MITYSIINESQLCDVEFGVRTAQKGISIEDALDNFIINPML